MANRKFLKIASLMSAVLMCNAVFGLDPVKPSSVTDAKNKNKKSDRRLLKTPAAEACKSRISDFLVTLPSGQCPEIRLVKSLKSMQMVMEELFEMDKMRRRIEQIAPSVQEKMKKAGADRSGLEKDPEIQEAMRLSLEAQKMMNQQQELADAAELLLLEILVSMNKNVILNTQYGELMRSEDADNNNSILLDAQELYNHCIRQLHADMMQSQSEKSDAKEGSGGKANTSKKKQQLSSDTEKSSSSKRAK